MRWTGTDVHNRRSFLAGAAAVHLAPTSGWADAGNAHHLGAAGMQDGSFRLFGLDAGLQIVFSIPLPARGHAAAAHPVRAEAVAFARRPGTFAIVLDCITGAVVTTLGAPPERHFYGHGVFSLDGTRLYTTENAYELGEGRIGIWAADDGYRRVGEFHSGGIGPHEITRLPGTDTLVVANGGIDTHPDTGRTKLNIPSMQPNLTYLDLAGTVLDQTQLPSRFRLSSIRHLCARSDGLVAFACQWQGDHASDTVLQGLHRMHDSMQLLQLPEKKAPTYAGSVAFSQSGDALGVTFPRSDGFATWALDDDRSGTWHALRDACGISPASNGFAVTSGAGDIVTGTHAVFAKSIRFADLNWDNHFVKVT